MTKEVKNTRFVFPELTGEQAFKLQEIINLKIYDLVKEIGINNDPEYTTPRLVKELGELSRIRQAFVAAKSVWRDIMISVPDKKEEEGK